MQDSTEQAVCTLQFRISQLRTISKQITARRLSKTEINEINKAAKNIKELIDTLKQDTKETTNESSSSKSSQEVCSLSSNDSGHDDDCECENCEESCSSDQNE